MRGSNGVLVYLGVLRKSDRVSDRVKEAIVATADIALLAATIPIPPFSGINARDDVAIAVLMR